MYTEDSAHLSSDNDRQTAFCLFGHQMTKLTYVNKEHAFQNKKNKCTNVFQCS